MPYKYQIKKGEEGRIFANARNLGNGLVESDQPLNSIYLTPVEEKAPADNAPDTVPKTGMPVNTPPAPQNPVSQNITPPLKEEAK
jgi:hypothetical protein